MMVCRHLTIPSSAILCTRRVLQVTAVHSFVSLFPFSLLVGSLYATMASDTESSFTAGTRPRPGIRK